MRTAGTELSICQVWRKQQGKGGKEPQEVRPKGDDLKAGREGSKDRRKVTRNESDFKVRKRGGISMPDAHIYRCVR